MRVRLLVVVTALVLPALIFGQSSACKDSLAVYFFLLEDCKITQAYPQVMREVYQEFAQDGVGFVGYFPSRVSQDATVQEFARKYQLPFPCTRTDAYEQAKRFGVSVTPEVVVYDVAQDAVAYQGRIDNLYEQVGRRRRVVTSHDLLQALRCLRAGCLVSPARTQAVGCFLD